LKFTKCVFLALSFEFQTFKNDKKEQKNERNNLRGKKMVEAGLRIPYPTFLFFLQAEKPKSS
jgi:hypothetical protein